MFRVGVMFRVLGWPLFFLLSDWWGGPVTIVFPSRILRMTEISTVSPLTFDDLAERRRP